MLRAQASHLLLKLGDLLRLLDPCLFGLDPCLFGLVQALLQALGMLPYLAG